VTLTAGVAIKVRDRNLFKGDQAGLYKYWKSAGKA
jgi:hypothetical protein